MAKEWIACTYKNVPWQQQMRAGTREDRMVKSIRACFPPEISKRKFALDSELISISEEAIGAIANLDNAHGRTLESLDRLLIRTESIASSKIENLQATTAEYARAMYGNKSNSSATAMAAGTEALTTLIDSIVPGSEFRENAIKKAHRTLMKNEPREVETAGKYRQVQNWIEGSDHSPRGAIFIPPPPKEVEELMKDLLAFANRDDMPSLIQAAIAHAQFETIHPFTDGNGRVGRALVNAILRRRRITTRVVVPLTSFLVVDRAAYFDDLTQYRDGSLSNLVKRFARAAKVASRESTLTANNLEKLPQIWRKKIGTTRTGSATSLLLDRLISQPVFSAEELIGDISYNSTSIYNAISKLSGSGIISSLTDRKRDQIWGAVDVLQEVDDLSKRIENEARREPI
jgi:Fic family protein